MRGNHGRDWYVRCIGSLLQHLRARRAIVAAAAITLAATAGVAAHQARPSTVAARSGVGWRLVFGDSFSQRVPLGHFPALVRHQWGAYPNGVHDTSGHGTYMPSKVVSVANGVLTMHLHTAGGRHEVAAVLPIIPHAHAGHGFLYGRVVLRLRATAQPGYKIAAILWPDNERWPSAGEIDFPEVDLNGYIFGAMHRSGARSGNDADNFSVRKTLRSWHTTTITWLHGSVTFQVDGHVIGQVRRRIPSTPMHLVIQAETSSTGGPPPSASVSDYVQVDSVAIYTPACNPTMSVVPRIAACAG